MTRNWNDVRQLAAELSARYPDVDPRQLPFAALRDALLGLPGSAPPAETLTGRLMEEVQQAWREGYAAEEEEERRSA